MRSHVRISLLAPLVGAILALVAVSAPAAQAAFGLESTFAANCKNTTCTAKTAEEHPSTELFTQAGGHPNGGITEFKINTVGTPPNAAPTGIVTHVRTDVGVGVSTNPEAVEKYSSKNSALKLLLVLP